MKEHKDLIDLIESLSQEDFERLLFTLLTNTRRELKQESENKLNSLLDTEILERNR